MSSSAIELLIKPTIDPNYRHASKEVVTGEPLSLPRALLKWYEVYPPGRPVPDDVRTLARQHLTAARLEAEGLGFVLLHRCGSDFYFLIIGTWRNSNELWETVFYKNGDSMNRFDTFPREGEHKPALCVWELVPVWHEQQAWVRFLSSARDGAAGEQWLGDRYSGAA